MEDEYMDSMVEPQVAAPEQTTTTEKNHTKTSVKADIPMSTISIVLSIIAIFFGLLGKVLVFANVVSTLVFLCLAIACIAASAVLYIIEIIQNKKVEFNVQIVLLIVAIFAC